MEWEIWQGRIIVLFKGAIVFVLGYIGKESIKKVKPSFIYFRELFKGSEKILAVQNQIVLNTEDVYILKGMITSYMRLEKNPMFITDAKGDLESVNDSWLEVMGFRDSDDALGKGYLQAIPTNEEVLRVEGISERLIKHPSPYSVKVDFINVTTRKRFSALCKSDPVYTKERKLFLTVGILYILPNE